MGRLEAGAGSALSSTTLVVSPEELAQASVGVTGDAYRHLFRARRLAAGQRLRLVDGRGNAVWGRIERVGPSKAELALEGPAPINEPSDEVEVWVGIPRPQRASWLIEKTTELGVVAVRWLDSARSGRSPGPAAIDRLRRVAVAAVEQCHRSRVPEISGPHGWDELRARLEEVGGAWVLQPNGPRRLGDSVNGSRLLLVGPEGGFEASERADLEAWGARPLSLGSRVLRVETAAVAGVTLLLCAVQR